jgi:hypothetical protein
VLSGEKSVTAPSTAITVEKPSTSTTVEKPASSGASALGAGLLRGQGAAMLGNLGNGPFAKALKQGGGALGGGR